MYNFEDYATRKPNLYVKSERRVWKGIFSCKVAEFVEQTAESQFGQLNHVRIRLWLQKGRYSRLPSKEDNERRGAVHQAAMSLQKVTLGRCCGLSTPHCGRGEGWCMEKVPNTCQHNTRKKVCYREINEKYRGCKKDSNKTKLTRSDFGDIRIWARKFTTPAPERPTKGQGPKTNYPKGAPRRGTAPRRQFVNWLIPTLAFTSESSFKIGTDICQISTRPTAPTALWNLSYDVFLLKWLNCEKYLYTQHRKEEIFVFLKREHSSNITQNQKPKSAKGTEAPK